MNKKKIGMMVAVEIGSVLRKYGTPKAEHDSFGFKVYEYDLGDTELFAVHSGAGEIAAAAATQLLIAVYNVDAIVNFGVVGGLTPEMKLARTVVVEKAVHYDFDTSAVDNCEVGRYLEYPDVYIPFTPELVSKAMETEPELKKVVCASGDKFIDSAEGKRRLAEHFGADICEMEAAAIALTCNRCHVPCLAIKTVSDSIEGGAEEFSKCVADSGDVALRITEKIMTLI